MVHTNINFFINSKGLKNINESACQFYILQKLVCWSKSSLLVIQERENLKSDKYENSCRSNFSNSKFSWE